MYVYFRNGNKARQKFRKSGGKEDLEVVMLTGMKRKIFSKRMSN